MCCGRRKCYFRWVPCYLILLGTILVDFVEFVVPSIVEVIYLLILSVVEVIFLPTFVTAVVVVLPALYETVRKIVVVVVLSSWNPPCWYWKFTKLFAQMWHKAIWKGHPMRLELTRVGLLVELANHYTTRGAFPCWYWICIFGGKHKKNFFLL